MTVSEKPAQRDTARLERRPVRLAATVESLAQAGIIRDGIAERLNVGLWRMVHPFGAHRWRDGYEVNTERGWAQYRGSRCTICDEPWEGW